VIVGESEVRRWRVREANKAVSIMVNKGFRQVRTGLILSFQDDPMARCDRASSQTQQASNQDPLDLVQADLIAAPVIKLQ
jgi:hypothetical protein